MPFTPAHAAAALPFRRTRLVMSALITGTVAPDIEYFLRLAAGGGFGHRIAGAFLLSLPLGLVFLWLFHRFVKVPATALFPNAIQARLQPYLGRFHFGPPRRFLLICLSMLIGIATHIVWDDFTHARSFVFHRWALLGHYVRLPFTHYWFAYYEIFQYISSIGGLAILAVWFALWCRRHAPAAPLPGRPFSPIQKIAILGSFTMISFMGAVLRALAGIGVPRNITTVEEFTGEFIVTFGALFWWQLVVWGAMLRMRAIRTGRSSSQSYTQSRS